MTRQALLVATSAVSQNLQRSVGTDVLRRTLARFERELRSLGDDHAFNVRILINESEDRTRAELRRAARAAGRNDLLLFYYFGHGDLTDDFALELVHRDGHLKFTAIENVIEESDVRKSLVMLDCCYAGASDRDFPMRLTGQHIRLACTTPTARAYIQSRSESGDPPIGTFTQTILDGFAGSGACVSAHDNRVTAESLFQFAYAETRALTNGVQRPQRSGHLDEPLCVYVPRPQMIAGYNTTAGDKTAYAKLFVICAALAEHGPFEDVEHLYRAILRTNRDAFLTPFKRETGEIVYQPASPNVLRKYLAFLRALDMIEEMRELALTPRGRRLVGGRETTYNTQLVTAIDGYLRPYGLDRARVEAVLLQILSLRGIPSRGEIFDRLRRGGQRIPATNLAMILDILGYAGALRMTRERAYFPWADANATRAPSRRTA
jgi:hypothetical protein